MAQRDTESAADPRELAEILGIEFQPDLLEQALTHRSYAYENGGIAHNERLEFFGDSVLGFTVTAILFDAYPDSSEGELATRRSQLVSTAALAEIAASIDLGRYVRLGRGELLTGGREKTSILADTMEAVIGATYFSAGLDATNALITRLVQPLLAQQHEGHARDPKSVLQELAATRGFDPPVYTVKESGPPHNRHFTATVTVRGLVSAHGSGRSKKLAELAAASTASQSLSNV